MPPLTKKLFVIGRCRGRESQFSSMEWHGVYQSQFRPATCSGVVDQHKTDTMMGLFGFCFHLYGGFFFGGGAVFVFVFLCVFPFLFVYVCFCVGLAFSKREKEYEVEWGGRRTGRRGKNMAKMYYMKIFKIFLNCKYNGILKNTEWKTQ